MFTIEAKVASQFAQIENAETTMGGISKIFLKKIKVLEEDSEGTNRELWVPVMTGNGIRGALRREMLNLMLDKMVKKGINCSKELLIDQNNLNMMNAGGGNDYQSQPYEILKKARELNPQISLFGTSLAVPGKIATPNAYSYNFDDKGNAKHVFKEGKSQNGNIFLYSPLIADETFVKKDDILQGGENVKYLTDEQIVEWREAVDDSQKIRSAERISADKDSKKTKKVSLQSMLAREYVISGTKFYTYFEPISEEFTNIEKGLLILSLEEFVTKKFGSNRARSYGSFEYKIDFDDKSKLHTKVDLVTGKVSNVYKDYTEELKTCVAEAEEWLENITCENVMLSEILK